MRLVPGFRRLKSSVKGFPKNWNNLRHERKQVKNRIEKLLGPNGPVKRKLRCLCRLEDQWTPRTKRSSRCASIFLTRRYTVVTSGDPNDTIQVAHEVDELMSQIARRAGNLDSTRTAVLACLHLADRLRTIENQFSALKESVDLKTRSITELLNQVIPED